MSKKERRKVKWLAYLKERRVDYTEYMKSPEWKKLREQVKNRDKQQCQDCGLLYGCLQVHHLTYERFKHELLDDLITLCDECHRKRHEAVNKVHVATKEK